MKEQTTLDGSEYIPISSDDWETPPELFEPLNQVYKFTLDPCCTSKTAKCDSYFTLKEDGLKQTWTGRVFVNPPFSNIPLWLKKIDYEMFKHNPELVVSLLPAWTDRDWFHDLVYGKASITFLQGRVKFLRNGRPHKSPKFGCMLVEWR